MFDNRLIDDGIIGDLTGSELKVYLVVLRKTIGYHKQSDLISISQIEKIAKLTKPAIIKALKNLKEKGLIIQTISEKYHTSGYGIPGNNAESVEEPIENTTQTCKESLQLEVETGKKSLPLNTETGKKSLPDNIETGKETSPLNNKSSKKSLPLKAESGKKSLPEVVKKVYIQNKEINNINKLYISSDEDISLEQAQSTQDSVDVNASTSQTKKINLDIYKDIESYYKNIYTGTFGRAPIINYGRVRKQIKSILNSGATVEQIKDAISKALADDWVMQGGFNIETILSAKTFNRVLNNPYKTDWQKSYSKEPYDEDEEFRRLEADLYTNDPAYKEWQELKRKKASGELDREFEEHRAEWEAFKEKMGAIK
jgi:phage replication O-like protein O